MLMASYSKCIFCQVNYFCFNNAGFGSTALKKIKQMNNELFFRKYLSHYLNMKIIQAHYENLT